MAEALRTHVVTLPRVNVATLKASVITFGLFLLALVLRLTHQASAYNIFIDEATYSEIARSVGDGNGIKLHGQAFTLHPPVGFLILGGIIRLAALQHSDIAPLLLALRPVSAWFGAVVIAVTYLLVRLTGRHRLAIGVALVLCLDPFQNSFDSRVMLEPIAQTFTAATFLAAAYLAHRGEATGRWWWLPAAGVGALGALTFLTKETFGLVVTAALALLLVLGKGLTRRQAAVVLAGTLTGYAVGNALVAWVAGFDAWWSARSSGLARLLGTHQITGFNAPGTKTSLLDAVITNLASYGPSYLVLATGGLAGVALLGPLLWEGLKRRQTGRRANPRPSPEASVVIIISAWTIAACAYVGYAVVFGSLEEQMFYIALTPCAAAMAVAFRVLGLGRSAFRRAATAALVIVLAAQVLVYYQIRSTDDDVYQSFLSWLPTHVQPDSRLAVTEDTAQFLITGQQLGEWHTLAALREHRVDYVLVVPSLAAQGYGKATPEFIAQVDRHGTLVYSKTGGAAGGLAPLQLYDVRSYTGGSR